MSNEDVDPFTKMFGAGAESGSVNALPMLWLWDQFSGNADARAAEAAGTEQEKFARKGEKVAVGAGKDAQAGQAPFTEAGAAAVGAQGDLLGLNGPEAQQRALAALQASPEFQALLQQGEEGILANASATGGLRGGNVQSALAQFRPQLLSQLINERFSQLGGLSGLGQQAATTSGQFGLQSAGLQGDFLTQIGQARAGGLLGAASARANARNQAANIGIGVLGAGAKAAAVL